MRFRPRPSPNPNADPNLGFEECVTDEGETYYADHTTGETRWELPEDFIPHAATLAPYTGGGTNRGQHEGRVSMPDVVQLLSLILGYQEGELSVEHPEVRSFAALSHQVHTTESLCTGDLLASHTTQMGMSQAMVDKLTASASQAQIDAVHLARFPPEEKVPNERPLWAPKTDTDKAHPIANLTPRTDLDLDPTNQVNRMANDLKYDLYGELSLFETKRFFSSMLACLPDDIPDEHMEVQRYVGLNKPGVVEALSEISSKQLESYYYRIYPEDKPPPDPTLTPETQRSHVDSAAKVPVVPSLDLKAATAKGRSTWGSVINDVEVAHKKDRRQKTKVEGRNVRGHVRNSVETEHRKHQKQHHVAKREWGGEKRKTKEKRANGAEEARMATESALEREKSTYHSPWSQDNLPTDGQLPPTPELEAIV